MLPNDASCCFEYLGDDVYSIQPGSALTLEQLHAFLCQFAHAHPVRLGTGVAVGCHAFYEGSNCLIVNFVDNHVSLAVVWEDKDALGAALLFLLQLPRRKRRAIRLESGQAEGQSWYLTVLVLQHILDSHDRVEFCRWRFRDEQVCRTLAQSPAVGVLDHCKFECLSLYLIMKGDVAWKDLTIVGMDPFEQSCWESLRVHKLTLDAPHFKPRPFRFSIPTLRHLVLRRCLVPLTLSTWLPRTLERLWIEKPSRYPLYCTVKEVTLKSMSQLPVLERFEFVAKPMRTQVYLNALSNCSFLKHLVILDLPSKMVENILNVLNYAQLQSVVLHLVGNEASLPTSLVAQSLSQQLLQNHQLTNFDIQKANSSHIREWEPSWTRSVDSLLQDNRFLDPYQSIRTDAIALHALTRLPTHNAQVVYRCLREKRTLLFV